MRTIARTITVLAASMLFSAVPILAAEDAGGFSNDMRQPTEKDECLLVSMNCRNQVDSIQQRIDRIQKEIDRGSAVYTNDELKILNERLDNAEKTLNDVTYGGA